MTSPLKEQLNFYVEFSRWYSQIIEDFKFDIKEDFASGELLSRIVSEKSNDWNLDLILKSFQKCLQNKNKIIIYGSGPSLKPTIKFLVKNNYFDQLNDSINLAADGAAIFLKQNQIHINGIFSDLDGITKEEFQHTDFMVVHAHGDNKDKLIYFKQEILDFKNLIGTNQGEPLHNLINPGGFTDGDRILYFLRSLLLPKHQIYLIGMDFNTIVGKYSKPDMSQNEEASLIKQKKLQYAVKLIEWVSQKINNQMFFVNCTASSNKFHYIPLEQFEAVLRNKQ